MPHNAGMALAVTSFLAFGALLVLFGANATELIEALGLDYGDLGLLGSMLSLGLGVGIVAAGPLIDRLPRRPLYLAACSVVMLATTTLGPETSYRALLLHTLAIGLGAGFYETVLNALVVETFGASAPRRLIFAHSAATLAASATPLLFEWAREASPIPWYQTFQIAGLLHAGLIVSVFFVPMQAPPARRAAEKAPPAAVPVGEAADDRTPAHGVDDRLALAAICVATFAYVGVESALTLFIADYTTSSLALDAERAARTISAFWGGLLMGRLAIGLSPRPAGAGATAALAAVAAGIVAAFGLGALPSPELAMAATGFFLGGVFPIMIGLAGIALPSSAGTAVGLAGGLGSLGGFVVPWLTGRVATATQLSTGLSTLSLWLALLVIAASVARHRGSRQRTLLLRQSDPEGLSSPGVR